MTYDTLWVQLTALKFIQLNVRCLKVMIANDVIHDAMSLATAITGIFMILARLISKHLNIIATERIASDA